MEAWQAVDLGIGTRVRVHNKSRLDHAFEGKHGSVVNPVTNPHGYVRIQLDGEPSTVLVHPESVEREAQRRGSR